MTTKRISEAAAASGFSADTLRYYERIGLLEPAARSPAGYRLYEDADIGTLRFIATAKTAGLVLDDIAELVGLWRSGDCEPVRDRLHALVCKRADSARAQAADLTAFAARLDRLASDLAGTTPPERCGHDCTCATVTVDASATMTVDAGAAEPVNTGLAAGPIAQECTLSD